MFFKLSLYLLFRKAFLFIYLFLLLACSTTYTEIEAEAKSSAQSKSNNLDTTACPASDFMSFVHVFQDDEKVQRAFIRYPYQLETYDPQNLEENPKIEHIPKERVMFPILETMQSLQSQGAQQDIEEVSVDQYKLSTWSQGSGASSKVYYFLWDTNCWFLTKIVDAST